MMDGVPFREGLFGLFCLHELVGRGLEEERLIGVAGLSDVQLHSICLLFLYCIS